MGERLREPAAKPAKPRKKPVATDLEEFARMLAAVLTKGQRTGFQDGGRVSQEESRVPGFLETLIGPSGDNNDFLDNVRSGVGQLGGQAIEAGLGKSYQELVAESRDMFPDTPAGSKQHRLAAQIAGERFGFLPTQLLGLGVEAFETFTGNDTFGTKLQDTKDDLIANAKGGFEGSIPGQLLSKFKQSQSRVGEIKKPQASTSIRGKTGGRAHFASGGFTPLAPGRQRVQRGTEQIPLNTIEGDGGAQARQDATTASLRAPAPNTPGGINPFAGRGGGGTFKPGGPGGLLAGGGIGGRGSSAAGPGAGGQAQNQRGFIDALSGFTPGGDAARARLQAQDPFGTGRGAQEEQLAGGFRTNVKGATDAARILGGQEFDQAQDRIGERLSSLGLTSSSARTAQVAREKGRLGERVAARGLEAGIAADEAAAGRRAGAVQNSLGAGSIISGNNQADLSGALTQSGQRLGAAEAAAGANQNLINSNNSFNLGSRAADLGDRSLEQGETQFARSLAQNQGQFDTTQQNQFPGSLPGGGQSLGSRLKARGQFGISAAEGGPVPTRREFEQFLTNIGQELSGGGVQTIGLNAGNVSKEANLTRRNQALAAFGGEQGAFKLFMDPDERARLRNQAQKFLRTGRGASASRGNLTSGQLLALGFGQANAPASIQGDMSGEEKGDLGVDPTAFVGTDLDLERARRGGGNLVGDEFLSSRGRRLQAERAAQSAQAAIDPRAGNRVGVGLQGRGITHAVASDGRPRQHGAGGGVPQPELPQEGGIQVPGLLDPRRQFYEEGGGVAPGADSGEDQIPAMLRSEELVVTPELVEELEAADPRLPQPQLIGALQRLAEKPMEFSEQAGEHVAARGGVAPGGRQDPFFDLLVQAGIIQDSTPESGVITPGMLQSPSVGVPGSRATVDDLIGGGPTPLDPAAHDGLDTPPPFSGVRGGASVIPGQVPDPFDSSNAALGFPDDLSGLPGPTTPDSFSETVGNAGERSFSLSGSPGISSGRGTVTEAPVIRTEDGTPLSDTFRQQSRLEVAQQRADLVRAAINADPIGGPEKSARLANSLQMAQREVEAAVNEVIAAEELKAANKTADAQLTNAKANLNESIAAGLQAQANKATAESALAKQLLEAAAVDPAVAQLLNIFEVQAKLAGKDPRAAAQLEAVMRRHFESLGVQLVEHGSLAQLFGAPEFELQPTQQAIGEEGADTQSGLPDPTLGQLTPEQLEGLNRFGVGM